MTGFDQIVGGALALAVVCVPVLARAEGGKSSAVTAMAEALFKEGKKLLAEKKVPEACRKFESSYRIDPAPGTLLNLAMCHEEEGKLATAWGEFLESMQLAKKSNRPDRLKIAKEHISAIEPRLPRFVVVVPEGATQMGLVVEMDGVPLEEGAWGTAIPIDLGEHKAVVKAAKHKSWEKTFVVENGKVATVVVPKLERIPDPVPPDPGGRWKKPLGFTALGVGTVLVGIGGYFGVRALSLGGEVAAKCEDLVCDEATWQSIEEGRRAATASNVLIGVGMAAAAAGTFFLVTAPKSPSEPSPTAGAFVRVSFSLNRQTIGIGGTF